MAVRTQKDTLRGRRLRRRQCPRQSLMAQRELLGGWIEVVEMKRTGMAVIATNGTTPPSLVDQGALHTAAPFRNRLRPTTLAPISATPLEDEFRLAVVAASVNDDCWLWAGARSAVRSV